MNNITEETKKFFESKNSFRVLFTIGVVLVAVLIFSAGVSVGFHKASFGRAWGEHYNENFGIGRRGGMMGPIGFEPGMMGYFPNSHGTVGKIIKIEANSIIVQDKDNIEKTVSLNVDTKIEKAREELKNSDLKIDDSIVVIGTPDEQGVITAKLIRVIPAPEFIK